MPWWKWGLFATVILLGIAILLIPYVMRRAWSGPEHDFTRSLNNMRQIGLALSEFEYEFGRMPDDVTAKVLRERNPENHIPIGNQSSNDFFHQLFAAGIVENPWIFYGGGIAKQRAREVVDGEPPLPPGTCGFAYIFRYEGSTPPISPLVVYPLKNDQRGFETNLFRNHFLKMSRNPGAVLYADNSVRQYKLDRKGRLIINGRDFFDPAQPHWDGKPFRVVWPE